MNGASKTAGRTPETTSGNPLKTAQQSLLGLFLVAIVLLIAQRFISFQLPAKEGIWDAALLILALATTLASLCRQLPAQNVLLATVIIAFISGGIHALGSTTGIPFGPAIYTAAGGPRFFDALSWFVPLLWIVVVLNSRGVARLILRPWRKLRVYGYWLMGITTLLTLIFDLGLEPFATRARHYWLWSPTKIAVDWYGTPLSNFLGWLVTALLILAFATPALMKKKPAKSKAGTDYYPLIVWVSLNLLFVAAAFSQHLTSAAIVSATACIAVIPFAVRGARW
ncbi:MAG TPA: carotenoid biosynthesis protein [Verrucomicrobiae bacterium]|jgi:putative membrane protein|nr:carotenoid biosynthesis protein [Verrucomicrobiae bacterium]